MTSFNGVSFGSGGHHNPGEAKTRCQELYNLEVNRDDAKATLDMEFPGQLSPHRLCNLLAGVYGRVRKNGPRQVTHTTSGSGLQIHQFRQSAGLHVRVGACGEDVEPQPAPEGFTATRYQIKRNRSLVEQGFGTKAGQTDKASTTATADDHYEYQSNADVPLKSALALRKARPATPTATTLVGHPVPGCPWKKKSTRRRSLSEATQAPGSGT
jgi:hypothetical protein